MQLTKREKEKIFHVESKCRFFFHLYRSPSTTYVKEANEFLFSTLIRIRTLFLALMSLGRKPPQAPETGGRKERASERGRERKTEQHGWQMPHLANVSIASAHFVTFPLRQCLLPPLSICLLVRALSGRAFGAASAFSLARNAGHSNVATFPLPRM